MDPREVPGLRFASCPMQPCKNNQNLHATYQNSGLRRYLLEEGKSSQAQPTQRTGRIHKADGRKHRQSTKEKRPTPLILNPLKHVEPQKHANQLKPRLCAMKSQKNPTGPVNTSFAAATKMALVPGNESLVLAAGHCGFGLGATPTAIANVQAVTQRFGPSQLAFLVVPMVGHSSSTSSMSW